MRRNKTRKLSEFQNKEVVGEADAEVGLIRSSLNVHWIWKFIENGAIQRIRLLLERNNGSYFRWYCLRDKLT